MPELADLVIQGLGRLDVNVLVSPENRQSAEQCLLHKGLTEAEIEEIRWVEVDVQTNWIRDYGPEFLAGPGGTRAMVDMSYYPSPTTHSCNHLAGRYEDDALPTAISWLEEGTFDVPVFRPQVKFEGGAIQSDGNGTCFRTRRVANARNNFSRW